MIYTYIHYYPSHPGHEFALAFELFQVPEYFEHGAVEKSSCLVLVTKGITQAYLDHIGIAVPVQFFLCPKVVSFTAFDDILPVGLQEAIIVLLD